MPPARLVSLDVADASGRLCGTLAFGDVALSFEVAESSDPPMIEDPASAYGQWATRPNLAPVLPPDVDADAYLHYLRAVIRAAEHGYQQVVTRALTAASTFLLAALNPATAGEVGTSCVDEVPEYVRSACGCGHELVFTPDGWQHDAAPWFWGDDHDADPGPVSDEEQERMDALLERYDDGDLDDDERATTSECHRRQHRRRSGRR